MRHLPYAAAFVMLSVAVALCVRSDRVALHRLESVSASIGFLEGRLDDAANVGIANTRQIHGIENRLADLARRVDADAKAAHGRRAALADELRREAKAAIGTLAADVAALSRRLGEESEARGLAGESLSRGLDGLRAALEVIGGELGRLKLRKPETIVRVETRIVERQPVYVSLPPVYYYLPAVPCR